MAKPFFLNHGAVSVDATAGGTELLGALTQANWSNASLVGVTVTPSADVYLVDGTTGTAANSSLYCPAGVASLIGTSLPSLKAITASGSSTVRVTTHWERP